MDDLSYSCGEDPCITFVDDRHDFAWRTFPRTMIGTLAILSVLAVMVTKGDVIRLVLSGQHWPAFIAFVVGVPFALLFIRWDIWFLQFGRRIKYVIDDDSLSVYRGEKPYVRVRFSDVSWWYDSHGIGLTWYWLGSGYWRTIDWPAALPRYSFEVATATGSREISPPALFRWRDRGGLTDVSTLLRERLGPPMNGS